MVRPVHASEGTEERKRYQGYGSGFGDLWMPAVGVGSPGAIETRESRASPRICRGRSEAGTCSEGHDEEV